MHKAGASMRQPAPRRCGACGWAIAFALCVFANASSADEMSELKPATPLDVQIAPGEHARYRVTLAAGTAAHVSLQQLDTMLQLRIHAGDAADAPVRSTQAGRMARLRVPLLADAAITANTWTIEVNAAKAGRSAHFRIDLGAARAITREDRAHALAERRFFEAEAIRLAAGGVEPGRRDADLAGARTRYRQSIDGWHASGEGCDELTAGVGLARFELAQARYPQAQAAAEKSLGATCNETDDLAGVADRAAALRTLAAARGYQGDFEASATLSEQALALYRRTGDQRFEGVVLGNLSAVYRSLGETQRALEAAEAALDIATLTHDAQGVAFSRENVGSAYLARGELANALAAYRRTLDDVAANPYPLTEGLVWNELGALYRRLGEADQARAAWAKARDVWAATGNRSGMAETWINEGELALAEDATATASAAFARALDIATADRLQSPRAHALRGLGEVAIQLHAFDDAARRLDEALALAREIGERAVEAAVERTYGDLDARRSQPAQARRHYARSATLASAAADSGGEAAATASIARLAVDAGAPADALAPLEKALATVEGERARLADPDLRTGYFASQRAYYDLYIDALIALAANDPRYATRAWQASERARARALQDLLDERGIGRDSNVDPALLATARAAEDRQRRLAYRVARLPASAHASERNTLVGDLDAASRTLDEARGRIRAAHPRFAELAHPQPLALDAVRRALDPGVGVLEYWLGDTRSVLWLITRDDVRWYALPPRADIERRVAAVRERLAKRASSTQAASFAQIAANESQHDADDAVELKALADQVLPQDARAHLGDDVLVVADGALQQVAFALFDHDAPASRRYAYLPALSLLRGATALPSSGERAGAVAIFADPVFAADDARLHEPSSAAANTDLLAAAGAVGIDRFARLAQTRGEAEAIAALAPPRNVDVALGFDATRARALGLPWDRYAIAHFATHALLNTAHPELSGVVMSLYDAYGAADDGFLRINDIYSLHMPVDLVVLGVCDSAAGAAPGSEGTFSLARAFFYAGARHVVASLWPADDRATAALMQAFYRGVLERGETASAALAHAQAEIRAQPRWHAPYYWAGWVVQGDWR